MVGGGILRWNAGFECGEGMLMLENGSSVYLVDEDGKSMLVPLTRKSSSFRLMLIPTVLKVPGFKCRVLFIGMEEVRPGKMVAYVDEPRDSFSEFEFTPLNLTTDVQQILGFRTSMTGFIFNSFGGNCTWQYTVWLFGGQGAEKEINNDMHRLDLFHTNPKCRDDRKDSFSNRVSLMSIVGNQPSARVGSSAVTNEEELWIIGGMKHDNSLVSDAWAFNVLSMSWKPLNFGKEFPYGTGFGCVERLSSGTLLVYGGRQEISSGFYARKDIYVHEANGESVWLPAGRRAYHGCAILKSGTFLFTVGGMNDWNTTPSL